MNKLTIISDNRIEIFAKTLIKYAEALDHSWYLIDNADEEVKRLINEIRYECDIIENLIEIEQ